MKFVNGDLYIKGETLALMGLILALVCIFLIVLLVADFIKKIKIAQKGGKGAVKRYEALISTPKSGEL